MATRRKSTATSRRKSTATSRRKSTATKKKDGKKSEAERTRMALDYLAGKVGPGDAEVVRSFMDGEGEPYEEYVRREGKAS